MVKDENRTVVKRHDFFPAVVAIAVIVAIPILATIFG